MKRILGGVALSALIAVGANDISAQQDRSHRGSSMRRQGVEAIMQMRDRLELTDDQLVDLEAIRSESVGRRSAAMAEVAEMRSQLSAGQIQRSDMMAFIEDRQEAGAGVADQQRERVGSILNEVQLESLAEMQTRRRAFTRGQMSSRRGAEGMRGRRGSRGGAAMRGGNGSRGGATMRGGRGSRGGTGGFRGARRSGRDGPPMGRGRRGGRGG